MTTTSDEPNQLVLSPEFSDVVVRAPLDDKSGFHDFKLHLCMLYDSPYFVKWTTKQKKTKSVPTIKSHFEAILKYLYNDGEVVFNNENLLDLITEGYRYTLPGFVTTLWSAFSTTATPSMIIDALNRRDNRIEFTDSWDESYLILAIKQKILTLFERIEEIDASNAIKTLLQCAEHQNPNTIRKAISLWAANKKIDMNALLQDVNSQSGDDTEVHDPGDKSDVKATLCHKNSAFTHVSVFRFKLKLSKEVSAQKIEICKVRVVSLSPLKLSVDGIFFRTFVIKIWDPTETFCLEAEGQRGVHDFGILNASEWAKNNTLLVEIHQAKSDGEAVSIKEPKAIKTQPFEYPTKKNRLSDFTVTCKNEDSKVTYKLHKYFLQKSPYFKRLFDSTVFLESKTNRVTLETPQHVFEVILRYLYKQDPFDGISSFIVDVILEASYFELNDFEAQLWEYFEEHADARSSVQALQLTTSNPLFEMRKANLKSVVRKNIKGVFQQLPLVSEWSLVQIILNEPVAKVQNPILVLQGIASWCETHEPKRKQQRVRGAFQKLFNTRNFHPLIALELKEEFPYLTSAKLDCFKWNIKETFLMNVKKDSVECNCLSGEDWKKTKLSLNNYKLRIHKVADKCEIRVHDQLSLHSYIIAFRTEVDLFAVISNIKEWTVNGFLCISIAGFQ